MQAAFNCAASANGNYCWAGSKVNGGRRGPRQVAAVSSRLAPSFLRLRARRRPPLGSLASKERLSSLWGASAGGLRELGSRLGHLDGTGSRGESTGLSTGEVALEHSLYPTPRASGKPGTGLGASLPSLRPLLPFFHFTKVLPRDEGCPTQHFQLQVATSPLTP